MGINLKCTGLSRGGGGGSHWLQSGPRYLQQRLIAVHCLFRSLREMNRRHQSHPGEPGNHSTTSRSVRPGAAAARHRPRLSQLDPACLPGIPQTGDFPRNLHLSHTNPLMCSRNSVHSAAIALTGSVPSPVSPSPVPGVANSLPKLAEMENCC